MYLIADGKPSIDYSLYVLKEIASVLDERLSEIERQIHRAMKLTGSATQQRGSVASDLWPASNT